jgi:hypothetical protein
MSRRPMVTTPVSPKAITTNDVQRLLESCDINDPAGVGDYAIPHTGRTLGPSINRGGAAAVR